MGAFDTTLGALLIGVFLNTYLFGLVSYQYAIYSTRADKDPLWLKFMVSLLCAMDTVHSASVIYMAWLYAVAHFAQPLNLLNSYWPYPFTALITVCTAFIVQGFFTYRIWKLTSHRAVVCLILTLAVGTFALGIATSIRAWKTHLLTQLPSFKPQLATWLVLEVTVDSIIAGILVYKLSSSRTGYKNSDSVINRLIRMSVQTGACAGLFAILCLIFFFAMPNSHFFAMFGIPISRVYTNTFMDTLLGRSGLRGILFNEPSDPVSGSANRRIRTVSASIQLHVHKEVHTATDNDESDRASVIKISKV